MKTTKWSHLKAVAYKDAPARYAEVQRKVGASAREIDLRAIREAAGKTQVEVAKSLSTSQGEISRLERREDFRISTLQQYVAALGGQLEVIANFGKRRVRLR
jgi:hypothetical protein